ncbi:hypothetical protein V8C86DRAFT_1569636 [Haematococcus lacustris]
MACRWPASGGCGGGSRVGAEPELLQQLASAHSVFKVVRCLPARLPPCLPARLPPCLPACPPACLPAYYSLLLICVASPPLHSVDHCLSALPCKTLLLSCVSSLLPPSLHPCLPPPTMLAAFLTHTRLCSLCCLWPSLPACLPTCLPPLTHMNNGAFHAAFHAPSMQPSMPFHAAFHAPSMQPFMPLPAARLPACLHACLHAPPLPCRLCCPGPRLSRR